MTVYIAWREKSDPFSEDGDWLIGVFSTLEKAKQVIDIPNYDCYITEEELDSQAESKVVYGR